jgi:phenylalanyl-tRNA synthetase beta chain
VLADSVPVADLLAAIRGADKQLVSDLSVFDVYAGKGIEEGHRSIGVEVTLQPQGETLTDKEIEAVMEKIVEKAGKATGATLRG